MLNVMVLKEHGTNCEEESKRAFELAAEKLESKVKVDIVHMNDLRELEGALKPYQILMFPGGFSFGDDTGSANAWANRIWNYKRDEMLEYVNGDNLILGVCNGFQALVNLGLLPALNNKYGQRQAALVHNDSARYIDRWVDVRFNDKSPWTKGLGRMSLPIAHGEGKFYADFETLVAIRSKELLAAEYVDGEICYYQNLHHNPNGSLENIAGICDESGRIFGMMPHPERAIFIEQLPNYTWLKEHYKRIGKELPDSGPGLQIFKNAIQYFK